MVAYLDRVLSERPYAAGDRFTAADTQLASAVHYTMEVMHVLPDRPVFKAYVARIADRPAFQRAQAKDKDMAMKLPFFQKQFAGQA
ncbi:MAG: glutathione S-transferase family protein, partial [Mesorhizobium sp.]|nr:glutathione S-transferase family protein [Mesorhizobium sp.]